MCFYGFFETENIDEKSNPEDFKSENLISHGK